MINIATISSGLAVTAFFVLSGFLITYLLIKEKEKIGSISIKQFYIRRVLRIWPLYYLILFVSFVILPLSGLFVYENPTTTILLYISLFANVALAFGYSSTIITPLWSIAVEEQFYLIWPHVINSGKFRSLIIRIGAGYFILKVLIHLINKVFYSVPDELIQLVDLTRIDSLAIGGFAALLFIETKFLKKQLTYFVFGVSIATIVAILFLPIIHHEVFSLLIASIILMLATNTKKKWLDIPIINGLGKISYGIYMYHTLVIFYVIKPILDSSGTKTNALFSIIITLSLTILISYLSYKLIEKRFINYKRKFVRV